MSYQNLPIEEAYRLLNSGALILVSTVSDEGIYNIAPVAWNTLAKKNPLRIVVGLGMGHQTTANIQANKKFIVLIPHISQTEMIKQTGTISGKEVKKFEHFNIKSFKGAEVDALIPEGVIGYIECTLHNLIDADGLGLVIGEGVVAGVNPEAFDHRLLSEKEAGKTVHHLGDRRFIAPGNEVIE